MVTLQLEYLSSFLAAHLRQVVPNANNKDHTVENVPAATHMEPHLCLDPCPSVIQRQLSEAFTKEGHEACSFSILIFRFHVRSKT